MGKYKFLSGIPDSLQRYNCSSLWKGISIVWRDVCSNLKWNIGNSRTVDFWYNLRVPDLDPLAGYVSTGSGQPPIPTLVANMADTNGEWRSDIFQHLLPLHVLLRIAAVRGPSAVLASDMVCKYKD
ncbi:hypothetical protein V6N13_108148 [Hibiscus sabdariffa]